MPREKLESPNLFFIDILRQPKATNILVFHCLDSKGAITFDHFTEGGRIIRFYRNGVTPPVAMLPIDSLWFALGYDQVEIEKVKDTITRTLNDQLELKALNEDLKAKYPKEMTSDLNKQMVTNDLVGHYF